MSACPPFHAFKVFSFYRLLQSVAACCPCGAISFFVCFFPVVLLPRFLIYLLRFMVFCVFSFHFHFHFISYSPFMATTSAGWCVFVAFDKFRQTSKYMPVNAIATPTNVWRSLVIWQMQSNCDVIVMHTHANVVLLRRSLPHSVPIVLLLWPPLLQRAANPLR